MSSPRPRWLGATLLLVGGAGVHELALRALVDHGVAGALLAGGGGWGPGLAAAGVLLLRLLGVVAWASLPALLVMGIAVRN